MESRFARGGRSVGLGGNSGVAQVRLLVAETVPTAASSLRARVRTLASRQPPPNSKPCKTEPLTRNTLKAAKIS